MFFSVGSLCCGICLQSRTAFPFSRITLIQFRWHAPKFPFTTKCCTQNLIYSHLLRNNFIIQLNWLQHSCQLHSWSKKINFGHKIASKKCVRSSRRSEKYAATARRYEIALLQNFLSPFLLYFLFHASSLHVAWNWVEEKKVYNAQSQSHRQRSIEHRTRVRPKALTIVLACKGCQINFIILFGPRKRWKFLSKYSNNHKHTARWNSKEKQQLSA